jgi:hypothetical protein
MNEDTTQVCLVLPDTEVTLTFLWPPTTPLPIVDDALRLPPTSPVQGTRLVTGRRWEIEYDTRRHCARPVLYLALSGDEVDRG